MNRWKIATTGGVVFGASLAALGWMLDQIHIPLLPDAIIVAPFLVLFVALRRIIEKDQGQGYTAWLRTVESSFPFIWGCVVTVTSGWIIRILLEPHP